MCQIIDKYLKQWVYIQCSATSYEAHYDSLIISRTAEFKEDLIDYIENTLNPKIYGGVLAKATLLWPNNLYKDFLDKGGSIYIVIIDSNTQNLEGKIIPINYTGIDTLDALLEMLFNNLKEYDINSIEDIYLLYGQPIDIRISIDKNSIDNSIKTLSKVFYV